MTRRHSLLSSTRFASLFLAPALALLAVVAVHGERAEACGWSGPEMSDLTTFDPGVIGDDLNTGLQFEPSEQGYWGTCASCAKTPIIDDWTGYLAVNGVAKADIEELVTKAGVPELDLIALRLAGTSVPMPQAYTSSTIWKASSTDKAKLAGAARYLSLAKAVEEYTLPDAAALGTAPPATLLVTALAGVKAASADAFLAQRYAFITVRIYFYQKEWKKLIAFAEANKSLAAPSAELQWRARWYLAGALRKAGKGALANLELARIGAGYPSLAGDASLDFSAVEETDWRATLKAAKTTAEKTMLWRLVGIQHDGLTAMKEIRKLDPASDHLAVLVVRELARAEAMGNDWNAEDPDVKKAQAKAYKELETIAVASASQAKMKRPWVYALVAGHLAARRGDLAKARPQLERAMSLAGSNARVANQVRASLSIGIALNWKITRENEKEVATAMLALTKDYPRYSAVRILVRRSLARAYGDAKQRVEAELLLPDSIDPFDVMPRSFGPTPWSSQLVKDLQAKRAKPTTEWEKFLADGGYTTEDLQRELALAYVTEGDYAAAAKATSWPGAKTKLGTDPFAIRINDCHDCDHQKYAKAKWTARTTIERMRDLATKAKGTGEPAAAAAVELGNALYNLTWYGNARALLADTHQQTRLPTAALAMYKRAFDLSSKQELKAKAAFLAAKAEIALALEAANQPGTDYENYVSIAPAKTWYPIFQRYAKTKYHKEVLKECGWYAAWDRASNP